MIENGILVTGDMALNGYTNVLKYAVKHVVGYANRLLISRAAKQVEDFAKAKEEERNTLLAVFGTAKGEGYVTNEIAIQKKGGDEWKIYLAMKTKLLTETITIDAFAKRLDVEMPESALSGLPSDDLAALDLFLIITPIADKVEKAQ